MVEDETEGGVVEGEVEGRGWWRESEFEGQDRKKRGALQRECSDITMTSSYLDALPCWVGVHAVVNVVLQTHGEPLHELCAGGDTVAVKMGARWLHWGKLTPTRL